MTYKLKSLSHSNVFYKPVRVYLKFMNYYAKKSEYLSKGPRKAVSLEVGRPFLNPLWTSIFNIWTIDILSCEFFEVNFFVAKKLIVWIVSLKESCKVYLLLSKNCFTWTIVF